ncbi:MAG TPA: hypothetical protein VIT91_16385 [Chthoniobacterales bacterium]
MRAPQVLLAVAVLAFAGFLVSPGFVDSIKGDGTVTMLPGFAAVAWQTLTVRSAVTHSAREALVVPLLPAHAAFVILPLVVAMGRFRQRALRYTFCVIFVCGLSSMAWTIWSFERVAFGVYLWLLAAVAAGSFCLLPGSYDT